MGGGGEGLEVTEPFMGILVIQGCSDVLQKVFLVCFVYYNSYVRLTDVIHIY